MKSFKKPLKKLKLSKKTFEINQNSNQDSVNAKPKAPSISSGEQNGGFELTKEEDQFINQSSSSKNRPRPDSLIIDSNMPTINEKNVQFRIVLIMIEPNKVGCVFMMVVVSLLLHAELGPIGYQEDERHFISILMDHTV